MSFSLAIRNGDLALNGNSFATVTEGAKVFQDLRCALLTPFEFYEKYPEYGSQLESVIGEHDWKKAATLVKGEIQRICSEYQSRQISRNRADSVTYGRLTITPSETLLRINNIEFIQVENHLIVKVQLLLGAGEVELNIPVE